MGRQETRKICRPPRPRAQQGFTLLEMMIVVAIVGILAAIAVPSYQSSIERTRRTDAQAALVALAQKMEQAYARNYSYQGLAAGGADTGIPAATLLPEAVDFYDLTISAAATNTYTVAAVPLGAQAADDCGTLSVDQAGSRTAIKAGASVPDCW